MLNKKCQYNDNQSVESIKIQNQHSSFTQTISIINITNNSTK